MKLIQIFNNQKMSGPETGQHKDFVDLTLSERFGYNRKSAGVYQGDTKSYNSSSRKTGTGRSCEEIDWQRNRLQGQRSLVVDLTDDSGIHLTFSYFNFCDPL